MTSAAATARSPRWSTFGVERPCTAKIPAMHAKPIATSRARYWPPPIAARATRKATSAATIETFDVMTRCSIGISHGWLRAGSARSQARTAAGSADSATAISGRADGLTRGSLGTRSGGGSDAGDLGEQLGEIERLGDHVGRRELLRVGAEVARGGEQHQRDLLLTRAQLARELPAVHDRHHEVEEDHVRLERADDRERFRAVRRRDDLEAFVLERAEEQLPDVGIVVDHEHTFPGHRRPVECHLSPGKTVKLAAEPSAAKPRIQQGSRRSRRRRARPRARAPRDGTRPPRRNPPPTARAR